MVADSDHFSTKKLSMNTKQRKTTTKLHKKKKHAPMPRTVLPSPRGYEEPLEHQHQIVPWVEPLRPDSHDSHDSHDSSDSHDKAVGEIPPSFVIHEISSAQRKERWTRPNDFYRSLVLMYLYTEIYNNTKSSWPKKSKTFGRWIRIRTQKEPLCLILKRYLRHKK